MMTTPGSFKDDQYILSSKTSCYYLCKELLNYSFKFYKNVNVKKKQSGMYIWWKNLPQFLLWIYAAWLIKSVFHSNFLETKFLNFNLYMKFSSVEACLTYYHWDLL